MVKNPLHKLVLINKIRIFINKKLKIDYTILKILHNFTVIAMILASIHVLMAFSTRENYIRIFIINLIFKEYFYSRYFSEICFHCQNIIIIGRSFITDIC